MRWKEFKSILYISNILFCCKICFCQCIACGQLYNRVFGEGCFSVSFVLWLLFALAVVFNILIVDESDNMMIVLAICSVMSFMCFGSLVLYMVRKGMRKHGEFDYGWGIDICVAWWCSCCSIIQLLGKAKIDGQNYQLCSINAI